MKRFLMLSLVSVAGCASSADKSEPRAAVEETDSGFGRGGLASAEPVDIYVDTGDRPLGAYTVRLLYDRESVRVVSVSPTDSFRAPDYSDKGFTSGSLTLSAYQVKPGPAGRVVVARVLFEPVTGGACALLVELVTLVDPDALPIRGRAGSSRIKIP